VLIANFILEIEGMLLRQWLILFTVSCFGNVVGLNLSAGMKSVVSIYILIPLVLVPQLLLGGAMIKFDDLHSSFTKKIYVPVIGDIMTTRWAYEAMAVEQFKNNKYKKLIFDEEMEISQNDWYSSFLIPHLKRKLRECEFAMGKDEYREHMNGNLGKIDKYATMLQLKAGMQFIYSTGGLTYSILDSTDVERLDFVLDSLQKGFRAIRLEAIARKDEILSRTEAEIGRNEMRILKQKHHNEMLAEILLNQTSIDKLYETDKLIVQKSDPVFMIPTTNYGRAHFFAPYKLLGKVKVDTILFNVIVIWLMSVVLIFTLYHDSLRKFLKMIESMKLPYTRSRFGR